MSEVAKVLFVDDSAETIAALTAHFSLKPTMKVLTAASEEEAIKVFQDQSPIAVVVCNIRMPDSNGVDFLYKVRKMWPNTRRIIMSSVTDVDTIVRMINKARIFHFIRKPCPVQIIDIIVGKALRRYENISAESDLIERSRESAAQSFLDILSKSNPVAFARAGRVASVVSQLVRLLGLTNVWLYEFAGRMSQIGCVSVPPEVLEKLYANAELNSVEHKMMDQYPKWGYELVKGLPKVGEAAQMILGQRDDFTGPHMPDPPRLSEEDKVLIKEGKKNPPPPYDPYAPENLSFMGDIKLRPTVVLGSELLRLAADVETMISSGLSLTDTILLLKDKKNWKKYNPKMVAVLDQVELPEAKKKIMEIPITQVTKYMFFEENVHALTGALLAKKGQKVTESHREHFVKFLELHNVQEMVKVSVPSS